MAGQKNWIVNEDPAIINVPFPDGYWQEDVSFETFLAAVGKRGLKPENIAGVMMETYQGVGPDFAPVEYVKQSPGMVRPAPGRAHLRRSAGGLRAHRKILGLRALRRHAGPHLLRQGHQQLAAASAR